MIFANGQKVESYGVETSAEYRVTDAWRGCVPLDLPRDFQFDAPFRYTSRLDNPTVAVAGYCELDLRLAWQATTNLEASIVGQKLRHDRHPELGVLATRQEIERSVYAKVAWRY